MVNTDYMYNRKLNILKSQEKIFNYLFCFFWAYSAIGLYFNQLAIIILGSGLGMLISNCVRYSIIAILVLLSKNYVFSKLSVKSILVPVVMLLILLCTAVFLPDNAEHIIPYFEYFFLTAIPMFLLGTCVNPNKEFIKLLAFVSFLSIIAGFMYYFYKILTGYSWEEHSLTFVSQLLPSFLILIGYFYIEKKVKTTVAMVLISMLFPLLLGSRGGIVCVIVFLFLMICKKLTSKTAWVFILFAILIVFFVSSASDKVMDFISSLVNDLSGSDRVIDLIETGGFLEDESRTRIFKNAFELGIMEKPVFGWGVFGDRTIRGSYPHNIVLEMLIQYGVFAGSLILISLFATVIKGYIKEKDDSTLIFLAMLITLGIIKKFLSGTYLDTDHFFLLLGYIMCNKNKLSSDNAN